MYKLHLVIFFTLLALCQQSLCQTKGRYQAAIYFESAKYNLSDSSITLLKSLVDSLRAKQKLNISISGNTDNVGDSIFNIKLSQARVRMVKNYLVQNGIDSNKIKFGYFGENKPLADNQTEDGKQKNRRVDIVAKWEIPVPVEPKGSIKELMAMLANPVSSFCISPTRDTVLFSDRGTKLIILARAFGDVKTGECITIEFKDALDQADMIFDNLTTVSNGALLESGGMAYINAKVGNRKLTLKDPNSVFLVFKTDNIKEGMEAFTGRRNSETDPINWIKSKKDEVWTSDTAFIKPLFAHFCAGAINGRGRDGCFLSSIVNKMRRKSQMKKQNKEAEKRIKSLFQQVNKDSSAVGDSIKDQESATIVGNYFISVSNLGWINCDRFPGQALISYEVLTPSSKSTTSYLAPKAMNSVMGGLPKNSNFLFQVPLALAFRFVALKFENNKAYMGTMEGNTSNPSDPVTYKHYEKIDDLKKAVRAGLGN